MRWLSCAYPSTSIDATRRRLNTLSNSNSTSTDAGTALDPQIMLFQKRLNAGYAAHPALDSVPLAEARRIAEVVREPFARGGPVMMHTLERQLVIDGRALRLRIYRPTAAAALPALIYLHGGGWRLFSIDTHDRVMREYAARAGIVVVGVDYALAPEAPYPAALQQVVAVLDWLQLQAESLGLDPSRLAMGGDSAGANLALSAAMRWRDSVHAASLSALVLNYGAFGCATDTDSHRRYTGPDYLLTSAEMRGFWHDYLAGADALDPFAQPLVAERQHLQGLPPTWLAVAECDVLRDDSIAMADRLRAASVDTRITIYPGTTHSFLEAMDFAAVSQRALDETAAWLRQQLDARSPR